MSFLALIPAVLAGTATTAETMGVIGGTLGAVGTGVSAAGAVSSGIAQSNMAKYNAEVQRQNAETLRKAGEVEAARVRQKGEDLLAQQRATYGAAGVEFEGSPLLLMQETAARVEQDALAARYGYQVKASQAEATAGLQDFYGSSALSSGWLGGAASLLKGGYEMFKPYPTSPLTVKVK